MITSGYMEAYMTRYGNQQPLMHPFWQFIINCVISAAGAGVVVGVANGAYGKSWGGAEFGGIFVVFLLACYGIWVVCIRDNDGGSGRSWLDDL